MSDIPGAWVLETFRRSGVDTELLARQFSDDVNLMLYGMDTVPSDSINRLLEGCARLSGNPNFGVMMNEKVDTTMYGLFGYLLLNSGTVKDLLSTLVRYYSIYHDNGQYYQVVLDEATVSISFSSDLPGFAFHRHTVEWALGFIPFFLSPALGKRAQPDIAHFVYESPKKLGKLRTYFGHHIEYGQSHNQLVYPRSILTQRISDVDPGMLKVLRKEAEHHLLLHQKDESLQKKINMFIFENLSGSGINTTDLASALNLSISTLKRKLARDGINFKTVKDSIRNDLAKRLLLQTNIQISEIAQRTGFSSPSSFTRFFIRCNREKPLVFRNLHSKVSHPTLSRKAG